MAIFSEKISECVWDIKYRFRHDEKVLDQTVDDTLDRVALAISKAEVSSQRKYWHKRFFELLQDFRFLPGGRIFAGAGTRRKVTLFNCFVMDIPQDSLEAIFEALKEGALTLQQGGGVGYDFSILRPKGTPADKSGGVASGPVSFMRIWNSMSAIIQSSGARRGAMMATLRCDHPDIEEFVHAKADPNELRQFNISVVVTDEFMQAVKKNEDWALVFPVQDNIKDDSEIIRRRWSGHFEPIPCRVFRRIKARSLWKNIIKSAYDFGDPGVLFEDTINRMNPLWYREWISTTNPCGEIPLSEYGACNLGSINLPAFVLEPFSSKARIDWGALEETVAVATRFLDDVISVSKFPLKAQHKAALAARRIGLGFTGLADALVMLGIRYGEKKSLQLTSEITQKIAYGTWNTSIALAREKGAFPHFQKKFYSQGNFVQGLPEEIRKGITRYGVRNSHHNAIAPAGTISLFANNVSNGIEPIFSASYKRQVRTVSGEIESFQVTDYAFHLWQQSNPSGKLPPNWADARTLTPKEHLLMQGAVQPYLDNAISKTINLSEDFPFEKLEEVYTTAYKLNLKGCTIFRPIPKKGGVLSIQDVDQCCPTSK